MNKEIVKRETRTPIEVLLGMDENNMVSAKKLYEFLELSPQNYARWCNENIINSPLAEEERDYQGILLNEEWGGQATTDYLLSIEFAKALCMTCRTERGHQAREYFLRTEKALVVTIKQYSNLASQLEEEIQQRQVIETRLENLAKDVATLRLESDKVSDFTKRNEPYFQKIINHYLKSHSSLLRKLANKDFITNRVIEMMEEMNAKFKYKWAECEYRSMYHRDVPRYKYTVIDCLPEYQLLFTLALAKLLDSLEDK